jgi:hypothetical protein
VAESCTICGSRSKRPVRKLLDTPSYVHGLIPSSLPFLCTSNSIRLECSFWNVLSSLLQVSDTGLQRTSFSAYGNVCTLMYLQSYYFKVSVEFQLRRLLCREFAFQALMWVSLLIPALERGRVGEFTVVIRGCIQKFPEWPPGVRTVNGTALCH